MPPKKDITYVLRKTYWKRSILNIWFSLRAALKPFVEGTIYNSVIIWLDFGRAARGFLEPWYDSRQYFRPMSIVATQHKSGKYSINNRLKELPNVADVIGKFSGGSIFRNFNWCLLQANFKKLKEKYWFQGHTT